MAEMHTESTIIHARINKNLQNLLNTHCRITGQKPSEVLREALSLHLTQSIGTEDILLAKMNALIKEINLLKAKQDIFTSFFEFWLDSFYASIPLLPESESERSIIMHHAMNRKNEMVKGFEYYIKKNPTFFERLTTDLQDYTNE